MFVFLDGGVGGVQVEGQHADDEDDEDDEERDGDLLLLRQDDVLLQSGVGLHALAVCADLSEHPCVAEGQDDDGDEHVGHLNDGVEYVGLEAGRVLGAALRGARFVPHGAKAGNCDGGRHCRPHPRRRHHAQDLAQLEMAAKRLGYGVVLVHADVHERVDGGHEAEAVEPAVDGAEGARAGPEDPAPLDQRRDGERHDGRAYQQVGHRQVHQEEVGASAHAPVADDDGQDHGVAHHGQEGRDGQDGGQDDGEGEIPAVIPEVHGLGLVAGGRRGVHGCRCRGRVHVRVSCGGRGGHADRLGVRTEHCQRLLADGP